jgi:coenzyme PQQ precursor peptide PqqA
VEISVERSRKNKKFLNGAFPTSSYIHAIEFTKRETDMNWVAPIVEEICVGMEVTSYDSADIDVAF